MKSLLLEDLVMNWRLSPPYPVTASVLALFNVLFVFMDALAFLSSFSVISDYVLSMCEFFLLGQKRKQTGFLTGIENLLPSAFSEEFGKISNFSILSE